MHASTSTVRTASGSSTMRTSSSSPKPTSLSPSRAIIPARRRGVHGVPGGSRPQLRTPMVRSHPGAMGTSILTGGFPADAEPPPAGGSSSTMTPSGTRRPTGSRNPAIAESPITLGSANVT